MTPKRHPFWMNARLGADKDGKITGYKIDFTVENGAYTSIGPVVVDRSLEMLSGSYSLPNVLCLSKLVYTNNGWGGAARGAGPPQVNFALESVMDMLAEKIGMDPFEFRMKNTLAPGESMSTGHVPDEWAFTDCLERMKPITNRPERTPPPKRTARSSGEWASPEPASESVPPTTFPTWPWSWIPTAASASMRRWPIRAKATTPCSPRSPLTSWTCPWTKSGWSPGTPN